jgi:hypothetical protein
MELSAYVADGLNTLLLDHNVRKRFEKKPSQMED